MNQPKVNYSISKILTLVGYHSTCTRWVGDLQDPLNRLKDLYDPPVWVTHQCSVEILQNNLPFKLIESEKLVR